MDMDSPEKGIDEMSDLRENDGSASVGELDLNSAIDKEEMGCGRFNENTSRSDNVRVDLNQHGQQGPLSLPVDCRDGVSESPRDKSHSLPTDFDQDDLRRTKFDYEQVRTESPSKDNHYQGEMDELNGSYFHKSSSQFKVQTFHSERGTEDFAHSQESPLTADANQGEKMEGNSDLDSPQDDNIKEFEKSQHQFPQPVYGEIEGEVTDHQTVKMDQPRYSLHSHGSTPERSTLPVTERQMSVSPKRSPCIHQSANGHEPLSSLQGIKDQTHSSRLHKQKHASPERSDQVKNSPPQDHLYSSARQISASPQRSQQGSRHKDVSSLKRISISPKPRYSPRSDRRHGRSSSRSPIRQKASSSKYKRDYRDRSRSRSPYARDRHPSSRRRYSPRQRSPPSSYHSRRHSPRRRPWSPPPNRSTGLGKPGKNLFVAGFSFLTTERDLERKFSRFGRVRDVRIVRDKRSGDSRGFGFLSLERDEDADAAIRALDETEWNGRIILVEKSNSSGR